jgi:hypothetical protein
MKVFVLSHTEARQRAAQYAILAPDGWSVRFSEPNRNLEQNAMMWALLERFSKQLKWPVNGEMVSLEPEEWKDLLSAAFKKETQRVAMGLDGGMVLLGMRTSRMSKPKFAQFMEFIQATAAQRGVDTSEK